MIRSTQEQLAMLLEIFPPLANFIPLLPAQRRLSRSQASWPLRIGRAGGWRWWGVCRSVWFYLVEPVAQCDAMDSYLLCDRAIGVALFRQCMQLLVFGVTRLSPQRIGIRQSPIMQISGKFIGYL